MFVCVAPGPMGDKGGGASCLEIYPKGGGDWLENRPIQLRGGVVFRNLLLVLSKQGSGLGISCSPVRQAGEEVWFL